MKKAFLEEKEGYKNPEKDTEENFFSNDR